MITRWDPFREMVSMRRAVDRLIENSVGNEEWNQVAEWNLALDVVEDEDAYTVKASIPGIKPDDVEITYNKGTLTIKGEVKDETETTKGEYHLRERRFGVFSRSIMLPTTVKSDDIHASVENGVLSLRLPKMEEIKPKRIQINSGETTKVINAKNK